MPDVNKVPFRHTLHTSGYRAHFAGDRLNVPGYAAPCPPDIRQCIPISTSSKFSAFFCSFL